MGVAFDDLTMDQAVEQALALTGTDGFHYVVTPNPELVELAGKDPVIRRALNEADLVLPDGIGVVYAGRILGRPLQGRCPGIDFAAGPMGELAKKRRRLPPAPQ